MLGAPGRLGEGRKEGVCRHEFRGLHSIHMQTCGCEVNPPCTHTCTHKYLHEETHDSPKPALNIGINC